MKIKHLDALCTLMNDLLADIDEDGGNPEFCYEALAKDMATAAAMIYDACMAGQKFAREQR